MGLVSLAILTILVYFSILCSVCVNILLIYMSICNYLGFIQDFELEGGQDGSKMIVAYVSVHGL